MNVFDMGVYYKRYFNQKVSYVNLQYQSLLNPGEGYHIISRKIGNVRVKIVDNV